MLRAIALPVIAILVVAAPAYAWAQSSDQKDIFGRPYTGWNALQFYCESAPFDPLPQFWRKTCRDLAVPAAR